MGAFGLEDPLRDGVEHVVEKLYDGGVNVRMISGDNTNSTTSCSK